MTESSMTANKSLNESTNTKMWKNRNVDISNSCKGQIQWFSKGIC